MKELAEATMPYMVAIIGFLIVYVLNGIKGEIKEVKVSVKNLETDLRGGITELDRRLSKMEIRCETHHA